MADHSHIEWTDATWNPITGCSVVSPGCKHCYAMTLAGTRLASHPSRVGLTQATKAGPVWTGEVRLNEGWLDQPLQWTRPRRIFVCAHGDLFHESVPDAWIDRVFVRMAAAPQHEFQVLTKRSARMAAYLAALPQRRAELDCDPLLDWMALPLPHVLIGVSVEDQVRADERRSHLAAAAALGWLTWVSYEPALGPVDWDGWEFIRWLVAGGESSGGARPMHPDWPRAARDFCAAHAIAFLFKQWGSWKEAGHDEDGPFVHEVEFTAETRDSDEVRSFTAIARNPGWLTADGRFFRRLAHLPPETAARLMDRIGKKAAGRTLDGVTHDGFPERAAA